MRSNIPVEQPSIIPAHRKTRSGGVVVRIAFYLIVVAGLLSFDVFASSAAVAQADSSAAEAAAQELPIGSQAPTGKVQLKPSLCIVKRGEKNCRIDLDVRWSASQPNEYCVFRQKEAKPLQCWENLSSGQHTDSLLAANNQNYQLVWLSDSAKVALGQAVLQVVNVVPDDRRKQRRRRHIWSVF